MKLVHTAIESVYLLNNKNAQTGVFLFSCFLFLYVIFVFSHDIFYVKIKPKRDDK